MHRRALIMALLTFPIAARAQSSSATRIEVLTDLVKSVGAAGDAISKLTSGFRELVIAGRDSYQYVAAARERARLVEISRRTTILVASANYPLTESVDEYLADPNEQRWKRVISYIGSTLKSVQGLLADVQTEDGSFVLEPAYLELNRALSSRESLLENLSSMSPPETEQERQLLRQVNEKYKVIIKNAEDAIFQLNQYIKENDEK